MSVDALDYERVAAQARERAAAGTVVKNRISPDLLPESEGLNQTLKSKSELPLNSDSGIHTTASHGHEGPCTDKCLNPAENVDCDHTGICEHTSGHVHDDNCKHGHDGIVLGKILSEEISLDFGNESTDSLLDRLFSGDTLAPAAMVGSCLDNTCGHNHKAADHGIHTHTNCNDICCTKTKSAALAAGSTDSYSPDLSRAPHSGVKAVNEPHVCNGVCGHHAADQINTFKPVNRIADIIENIPSRPVRSEYIASAEQSNNTQALQLQKTPENIPAVTPLNKAAETQTNTPLAPAQILYRLPEISQNTEGQINYARPYPASQITEIKIHNINLNQNHENKPQSDFMLKKIRESAEKQISAAVGKSDGIINYLPDKRTVEISKVSINTRNSDAAFTGKSDLLIKKEIISEAIRSDSKTKRYQAQNQAENQAKNQAVQTLVNLRAVLKEQAGKEFRKTDLVNYGLKAAENPVRFLAKMDYKNHAEIRSASTGSRVRTSSVRTGRFAAVRSQNTALYTLKNNYQDRKDAGTFKTKNFNPQAAAHPGKLSANLQRVLKSRQDVKKNESKQSVILKSSVRSHSVSKKISRVSQTENQKNTLFIKKVALTKPGFREKVASARTEVLKRLEKKYEKIISVSPKISSYLNLAVLGGIIKSETKPSAPSEKKHNILSRLLNLKKPGDQVTNEKIVIRKKINEIHKRYARNFKFLKNEELWLFLLILLGHKKKKIEENHQFSFKLLELLNRNMSGVSTGENSEWQLMDMIQYILSYYPELLDVQQRKFLKLKYDLWQKQQKI